MENFVVFGTTNNLQNKLHQRAKASVEALFPLAFYSLVPFVSAKLTLEWARTICIWCLFSQLVVMLKITA